MNMIGNDNFNVHIYVKKIVSVLYINEYLYN